MWHIETTDRFDEWFNAQVDDVRTQILALLIVLKEKGPVLQRPYADTVKGSEFGNMKELRVQAGGLPYRIFFAFDPYQTGIILCAGCKKGKDQKKFYDKMIKVADEEFKACLMKKRS